MSHLTFMKNEQREYYAVPSRLIVEEDAPLSNGIEFEIIPKESMEPFLTGQVTGTSRSNNFYKAWESFKQHGISSEEFKYDKLYYLSEASVDYLTVFFDNLPEKNLMNGRDYHKYKNTRWYLITVTESSSPYRCLLEDPCQTESHEMFCSIKLLPQKDYEALSKIHELVTIKGKKLQDNAMVGAVAPTTIFHAVEFYYVGAALCAGIVDNTNTVQAFFDFGYIPGITSSSAFAQANIPKAVACLNLIHTDLQNNPGKTMIISHWHRDHANLIYQFRNINMYAAFWQNSDWYVPQNTIGTPFSGRANGLVQANNSGNFYVINNLAAQVNPSGASAPSVAINGNNDIGIGKIDAYPRTGNSQGDAHHHGIYARVMLDTNPNNPANRREVFLAGDCTYAGIPANEKNNSCYLQASHHGGNYALAPVVRNNRNLAIPIPRNCCQNCPNPCASGVCDNMVVYSANTRTHGHPNPIVMNQHRRRGWINHAITVHSPLATPYVSVTYN